MPYMFSKLDNDGYKIKFFKKATDKFLSFPKKEEQMKKEEFTTQDFFKVKDPEFMPVRATKHSAGYDIFSKEFVDLNAPYRTNKVAKVRTGVWLADDFPKDHCVLVLPRSGLVYKKGITVSNSPGLIDADYKDEICVLLHTLTQAPTQIEVGDPIAQLLVIEYKYIIDIFTERDGGFGSTVE